MMMVMVTRGDLGQRLDAAQSNESSERQRPEQNVAAADPRILRTGNRAQKGPAPGPASRPPHDLSPQCQGDAHHVVLAQRRHHGQRDEGQHLRGRVTVMAEPRMLTYLVIHLVLKLWNMEIWRPSHFLCAANGTCCLPGFLSVAALAPERSCFVPGMLKLAIKYENWGPAADKSCLISITAATQ